MESVLVVTDLAIGLIIRSVQVWITNINVVCVEVAVSVIYAMAKEGAN